MMLDWLLYRYNLARLQRANRKALIPLEKEHRAAKSDNERSEAFAGLMPEVERHRDEEATLQTHYLCELAAKRLIPLPEMSDAAVLRKPERSSKWRQGTAYAGLILTDEGLRELRLALRNDHRERLEIVRSWIVPVLTAVLGYLLGFLTHR
jgi:hypothetical protein